ncbi:MAG: C45 family peptidase [Arthrobacter sp.]|jgi:isopenicillin-N N-acyltransferase-like protein|nr:C45 family peptidase [Arthrobacter sp.]
MGYPRIRVSGAPRERGEQYGRLAAEQIAAARAGYEASFAAKGISWADAVGLAARHEAPIRAAFPAIWREIEGIAAGSGLPVADVLAMNCRTEILWSALTDTPAGAGSSKGECSSFALSPERTEVHRALIGQNWDWLVHAFDSVILLEVEREDGPNYVTIVEAGLLGKTMLNAAGLGLCVNTLVTTADGIADGVPFHVMLRAMADCEHAYDAVELLAGHRRASSGNYVLGTENGAILNVEVEPGGPEGVHPVIESGGATFHTNHFVSPLVGGADLAPVAMSDSYVRLGRLTSLVQADPVVGVAELHEALTDHTDAPGSICCHPDPRSPEASQWASIMSVVIDPAARVLHLAEGNPCVTPRVALDYSGLLGGAGADSERAMQEVGA